MWYPRHGNTYKRSVVLNLHQARYWLAVGAQPTDRCARLLSFFKMFPKPVTPFGSGSLYAKPEKDHHVAPFMKRKDWPGLKTAQVHYRQKLQEEMNRTIRSQLLQAEAISNLGNEKEMELVKTDDIGSEEDDAFRRVEKFEELKKRLDTHSTVKANDLRFNVYLKKMNKLVKKDLGLDLEAYKNFVNNIKQFAKFNNDYEILAQDGYDIPRGVFPGLGDPDLDAGLAIHYNGVMQDESVARVLDKTKRLRITLRKIQHDWRMQIYTKDYDIVEEFE